MNRTQNSILLGLFAMILAAGATEAQAEKSRDETARELQLFSQATISLIDAINAAEQKTGGKALEAELDDDASTVQFEVEVVKDGRIHKVIVDGKTGGVLKVSLEDEFD